MTHKSKCKYNDDHTHEALHTAHVLIATWSNHVLDTKCADKFPDVKNAVLKAEIAMCNAYRLIGQKFNKDLMMTDEEIDKRNEIYLIAAAIAIGFEDLGDDNFKCNKDQLINLISLCVKSALDGTVYE